MADLFDDVLSFEEEHMQKGHEEGVRCAAVAAISRPGGSPSASGPRRHRGCRSLALAGGSGQLLPCLSRRDGKIEGIREGRELGVQKGYEIGGQQEEAGREASLSTGRGMLQG